MDDIDQGQPSQETHLPPGTSIIPFRPRRTSANVEADSIPEPPRHAAENLTEDALDAAVIQKLGCRPSWFDFLRKTVRYLKRHDVNKIIVPVWTTTHSLSVAVTRIEADHPTLFTIMHETMQTFPHRNATKRDHNVFVPAFMNTPLVGHLEEHVGGRFDMNLHRDLVEYCSTENDERHLIARVAKRVKKLKFDSFQKLFSQEEMYDLLTKLLNDKDIKRKEATRKEARRKKDARKKAKAQRKDPARKEARRKEAQRKKAAQRKAVREEAAQEELRGNVKEIRSEDPENDMMDIVSEN
ncbi:hypothetical protein G7046_g3943 [Stylonectria norvegica]|nr:hypothetical protein G7046_g3943 [Stylonectria norvegica]